MFRPGSDYPQQAFSANRNSTHLGASPIGDHAPARTLPNNIELEQAMLGAILIDNDAFHRVSDFLEPRHFFEPFHQKVYEIAASLLRAGKVATPITLKTFLAVDINISGMTVSQYLARLAAEATAVITAADYGRAIYDLALRRSLIDIGEDLTAAAHDALVDSGATQIAAGAIEVLDGIVTSRADRHLARMQIGAAATDAMERLSNAIQNPGRLPGISWGLRSIDDLTGGLCSGDMIVVAARPSMGKTGFILSTALRVARAGHSAIFFSLEMTAAPLSERAITDIAYDRRRPVSYFDFRMGNVSPEDYERLDDAARLLRDLPLEIEQQPALSVGQIAARARKFSQTLERKGKQLGLIVVDHIQIVRAAAADRARRRVDEMTTITCDLKALAKELNVPLIAISQVSRKVEERDDKQLRLSDLRDSGSIEQDADVVIFPFREEYYIERELRENLPEDEKQKLEALLFEARNKLEIAIAKQRNGVVATRTVFFDAKCNHLDDRETQRGAVAAHFVWHVTFLIIPRFAATRSAGYRRGCGL
jgi:replicative DNA helicase